MVRVAVTGGIACGKSLVGRHLAQCGAAVCEADELAHDLMSRGQPVSRAVVAAFGKDILDSGGEIDRGRLGARVFADGDELRKLNALVHPAVEAAWQAWLRAREADSEEAVVVIPLLYEAGAGSGWDAVICVASTPPTQLRRLRERGLTCAQARARTAAQMRTSRKEELADYVIVNEAGRDLLREQTLRVWRSIRER